MKVLELSPLMGAGTERKVNIMPGSFALSIWATLTGCAPDANRMPHQVHEITLNGLSREFMVSEPSGLSGFAETPVVFMFHGTSGDGMKYDNVSG